MPTTPVSPSNPNFLLQVSPPPTRQLLEDAASNLRVVEAVQAVVPNWPPLVSEEEVVEGQVVEVPDQLKVCEEPEVMAGDDIVDFEDEDGVDDARALQDAVKYLEKLDWDDNDLLYFFNQAEIKMAAVGVKKNYTKFQVLSTIIPKKVTDQVKPFLRKRETEFPNKDSYKQLKAAILRIFGPKPEVAVDRALGRVMTGKPSELARDLVNDINEDLDCDKCAAVVGSLWKRSLPSNIKAGIAHMKFSKDNFEAIITLADDIFETGGPSNSYSVAAVGPAVQGVAPLAPLNETLPALPYPVPEVNAVRRGGYQQQRGGGQRGGRGRGGGGRGQQRPPANNGGGGSNNGEASNGGGGQRYSGTKHPDLPPGEWRGCKMHFKWGRNSHFCSEPSTCPWRDIYTPRPQK